MFEVGDLVFAKIKGYRAWPAKILSLEKKGTMVMFYGTFERGRITEQNIWKFDESTKARFKNATKVAQAMFDKGLYEIEHDPGVIDNFIEGGESPPKKKRKSTLNVKEHRKMWVQVKDTEDIIEIDLDKNRPANFASKEDAFQWEEKTARDALKFKQLVEAGKFVPEEVVQRLEQKEHKTKAEQDILLKWAILNQGRAQKIEWLKVEAKIAEIEKSLRRSLHPDHPELDKCLELLKDLKSQPISPLMLKKQPEVMRTLHHMCNYVGPVSVKTDKSTAKIGEIRSNSIAIFAKLEAMFDIPSGQNFMFFFERLLDDFHKTLKGMNPDQVTFMTSDPTLKES